MLALPYLDFLTHNELRQLISKESLKNIRRSSVSEWNRVFFIPDF